MRRIILSVALLVAGAVALSPLFAQDAKPGVGGQAPKDAVHAPPSPSRVTAAGRTPEQIQADLQKAGGELRQILTSPDVLLDPVQRRGAAPRAIPVIKRMVAGLDEVAEVEPQAKASILEARLEFLTILTVFGDAGSAAELEKLAGDKGPQAVDAQASRHLVAFWRDPKDEAAQLKVLDEVKKLAQANPTSEQLGQTVMKMANMGPASKAVTERAEDIILADLKGEFADQVGSQIKGQRKVRESMGKPVELAGKQLDGTPLSTKNWKGKVILVDFWATWCQPCMEELPRVKRMYLDHHAKGLEILGVSCDTEAEELKGFLAKNKDMQWPQLFDATQNPKLEWNPLAKDWGITSIPTMFLIDRKGILRSVEAGRDYEEQIPKLLAEKAE
jgi:thiol-disulfide isomerase/thioredoxin